MALILKYKKLLETSSYLTLQDDTGDYDPSTNITGYGDPNPERASLNLGIVVTYKHSEGNKGLVVTRTTPNSSTVENVTAWKVDLQGAGWHKIAIFAAPNFDELVIYKQYDIVYESNLDKFYYYYNSESSIPGTFNVDNGWVELTDADIVEKTINTDTYLIYKLIKSDFLTQSIDVAFTKASIEYVKSEDCKKCAKSNGGFEIFTLKVAAQSLAALGNYMEGQNIIEFLENKIGSSNCGC